MVEAKNMERRLIISVLILTCLVIALFSPIITNKVDASPPIIQITDNNAYDGEPSLTQSSMDTYYLVWDSDITGNSDIWICESTDATNWEDYRQVTTYNGGDYSPSIIEGNNDHLLVAFGSTQGTPWGDKVYLSRSTDGGDNWSTPVLREPYCSGNPNLLKAEDGTLYFSRHRIGSLTKISESTDNGYNWNHISTISNHPNVLHSKMREYDGDLFMVCDSRQGGVPTPSNLYFYKSTDGGHTWTETSSMVSSYEDRFATFVKNNDGQYITVWCSKTRGGSGKNDLYYCTSDDFVNWSTPQPLMVSSSYNDHAPCLLKDNTDELFIAWQSDRDGDYEIYIAKLYDLIGGKEPISVLIDIKPGSYPNSINPKSKGNVPVAILTTDEFDADTVNSDTVVFLNATPIKWTMEDVDDDGVDDMLFHFKTQELDFDLLSEEMDENGYPYAYLTGETTDETPIEGKDSVNLVPKGK